MRKPSIILTLLLTVLVCCLAMLSFEQKSPPTLTMYCAAGMRAPIEEIAKAYEQSTNTQIQVIYNGSGALSSQIKLGQGDLFLPANDWFLEQSKPFLETTRYPIVQQEAVIVVHVDNSSIRKLADLVTPSLKISFADDSAAIGSFAKKQLVKVNLWEAVSPQIVVYKPTVNSVIEDVALQSVDATIAWKSTASNYSEIKTIHSPELSTPKPQASIAILKKSTNKVIAKEFIGYLLSAEAKTIFEKHHFQTLTALP